jgi:hypothetical protein
MSRNSIIIICASIISGLTLALGCGQGLEDTGAGDVEAQQQPLNTIAELELDNGARVAFHELVPGEILIEGDADAKGKLAELEALQERKASPSTIYRVLARKDAPAALVHAEQRADAAMERESALPAQLPAPTAPEEAGSQTVDGIGVKTGALSGSSFQSSYCRSPSYWDGVWCWLYVTGTANVSWFGTRMGCSVNPTRGNVQLDVKIWGWPHQEYHFYVLKDRVKTMYSYGPRIVREMGVSYAGGDIYHFEVHADY